MQRMEVRVIHLHKSVSQLTVAKDVIEMKYHDLIEDYHKVICQRDAFEYLYEKKTIEYLKKKYQIAINTPIKREHSSVSVVNHSPLYSEESVDSYSPKSL